MTAVLVGLYWLVTAVAGAAIVGTVRAPLRLEERLAVSAVVGVVGSSLLSLLAALVIGIGDPAVFAGPLLLIGVAAAVAQLAGDPRDPWRNAWREARQRWRSRALFPIIALAIVALVGFSLGLAHALYSDGAGNIVAGYNTVWADWSLHATAASSFAVGHNVPPQDPLVSGMAFRYPFLPDFNSGMLLTLGTSMAVALEMPMVVLFVAVTVLVVSLAQRLTQSFAAGVVAMAVVLLGGGLGFVGVYWDACRQNGYSDSDCSPGHLLTHPGDAVTIGSANLRESFAVVHQQPRAYDALETPAVQSTFGDVQQWPTPLMGWWLPQRGFVYGFAVAVSVLLLVYVGLQRAPPFASAYRLAGALIGALPLIHLHTLVALGTALTIMALWRRRRVFLEMAAIAAVLAAPRLVQVGSGPHGQTDGPFGDNAFPYLEPGWKWNSDPQWAHIHLAGGNVWGALGRIVDVAKTPSFWGFWILNAGVLVPLCAAVIVVVVARRFGRGRLGDVATRLGHALDTDLVFVCLPLLAVFPIANLLVMQSWDWDNTKLFVYWQLGAALLAGALISSWWRARGWRFGIATLGLLSIVGTGLLTAINMMPLVSSHNLYGSYVWEGVSDQQLAAQVAATTPTSAVILTGGSHRDPLLTLAGRSTVVGYSGWLFSEGSDVGSRLGDVATMYRGCPGQSLAGCPAIALLRQYDVSFVEVGPAEQQAFSADAQWWSSHFAVIAHAGDVFVYDVRPK